MCASQCKFEASMMKSINYYGPW